MRLGFGFDIAQPVGLTAHQSEVKLGPEMVSNGDFSQGVTGWTTGEAGVSQAVINGELEITTGASGVLGSYQAISGLTVGRTYQCSATIRRGTTASVRVRITEGGGLSTTVADGPMVTATVATPTVFQFIATAVTHRVYLRNGTYSSKGYYGSISVREILAEG